MADYTSFGGSGERLHDNGDGTFSLYVTPSAAAGGAVQKVSAGGAAPGQSLKQYTAKVALSATVPTTLTLETVATGKTFYITDAFLSHDTAAVIDTRIQAAGVDIFRAPVKGDTAPVQMPGFETQPQAASGTLVTVVWAASAGPPNGYANIFGYEQ